MENECAWSYKWIVSKASMCHYIDHWHCDWDSYCLGLKQIIEYRGKMYWVIINSFQFSRCNKRSVRRYCQGCHGTCGLCRPTGRVNCKKQIVWVDHSFRGLSANWKKSNKLSLLQIANAYLNINSLRVIMLYKWISWHWHSLAYALYQARPGKRPVLVLEYHSGQTSQNHLNSMARPLSQVYHNRTQLTLCLV